MSIMGIILAVVIVGGTGLFIASSWESLIKRLQ